MNKYGWVDIGSSFLPSEVTAAFLYAQLENLNKIQSKRKELWDKYNEGLKILENLGMRLPKIPSYASNNAHMFYVVCNNLAQRTEIINILSGYGILSVFHYLSLHKSLFYQSIYEGKELPESDRYSDCLLRLPLYFELSDSDVTTIINIINGIFKTKC